MKHIRFSLEICFTGSYALMRHSVNLSNLQSTTVRCLLSTLLALRTLRSLSFALMLARGFAFAFGVRVRVRGCVHRLETLALYGCTEVSLGTVEALLSTLPSIRFVGHDVDRQQEAEGQ